MPATSESAYATIPDWCQLSGMRPASTYDALSRGDLRAKKIGKRVLIDVQHGLAWIHGLPDAQIRLQRAPHRTAAAMETTQ
jgi:hypothetical protein